MLSPTILSNVKQALLPTVTPHIIILLFSADSQEMAPSTRSGQHARSQSRESDQVLLSRTPSAEPIPRERSATPSIKERIQAAQIRRDELLNLQQQN